MVAATCIQRESCVAVDETGVRESCLDSVASSLGQCRQTAVMPLFDDEKVLRSGSVDSCNAYSASEYEAESGATEGADAGNDRTDCCASDCTRPCASQSQGDSTAIITTTNFVDFVVFQCLHNYSI